MNNKKVNQKQPDDPNKIQGAAFSVVFIISCILIDIFDNTLTDLVILAFASLANYGIGIDAGKFIERENSKKL